MECDNADSPRFMHLSYAEVTYFINQVALSAMSVGVAKEDLAVVQAALTQRIENVAVQAIGKLPGTPVPKSRSTGKKGATPSSTRRRKDDLDRLIDRAVAARRSENGEQR